MISNRRHDRLLRDKDRQVAQLLDVIDRQANQLMHLTGRPWTPAPADMVETPVEDEREPALINPDHWPDDGFE